MSRNFTDADLAKLAEILTASNLHHCHFKPESIQALIDFSQQIEDPKIRQGIISVGEAYNETSSMARRWMIRAFFLFTMLGAIVAATNKINWKGVFTP